MVKKSKVLNVNGNGTWESSYGLYYKWEVEFENGDAGQNLTKTEQNNYFVVGEEVEYIREEKGKFINIKRPKLDNFQSNNQSFKKDDMASLGIEFLKATNVIDKISASNITS